MLKLLYIFTALFAIIGGFIGYHVEGAGGLAIALSIAAMSAVTFGIIGFCIKDPSSNH